MGVIICYDVNYWLNIWNILCACVLIAIRNQNKLKGDNWYLVTTWRLFAQCGYRWQKVAQNTKTRSEWDGAFIFTPLDSSRWADNFGVVERQNPTKMTNLWAPKNCLRLPREFDFCAGAKRHLLMKPLHSWCSHSHVTDARNARHFWELLGSPFIA